ncbi:MAG: hypothetical protein ACFFHD_14460 [Promethearchaeota archaeon]
MHAVVPSGAIGDVPDTEIKFPILTALENPIGSSNGDPEEIFFLVISVHQ